MNKKEEDAFKQLLIIDSLRGEHSTGTAFVDVHNDIHLAKTVGDPFQLIETVAFDAGMRQANKCLIGHNRYATVGKIIRKNAHPFHVGDVVGAHNGTLTNKSVLQDSYKFDTDSEAIFNSINIKGAKKTLEEVTGAYALAWFDNQENAVSLLRNKERPLFCAWLKERKALFWASEAWMLHTILTRNELAYEDVWLVPEDKKHTFFIPNRMQAFDDPDVEEIKQRLPSFNQGGYMGRPVSTTKETTAVVTSKPHINNVITLSQGALKGKELSLIPRFIAGKAGIFYVSFASIEYPNIAFRVFRQTMDECQEVLEKGVCIATIGGFKHNNEKYYKVAFDSLQYPTEKKITRGDQSH